MEAEEEAFQRQPLHDFFTLHPEVAEFVTKYELGYMMTPRLLRSVRSVQSVADRTRKKGSGALPNLSSEEVTQKTKDEAERLGLSAVGFVPRDPKYTFSEHISTQGETVIVCILEQDYEDTQKAPSVKAEQAAYRCCADTGERTAKLSRFLQELGYGAIPHSIVGQGIAIHYAVQAGLGQLGLNGQLLTPAAGSRVRIMLVSTNAPLVHDRPVDFGITGLCDQCQICVRRCPVGAIPQSRKIHRGVLKSKINTKRCLPVVVKADGCAVCTKVCPVQRFGLTQVLKHYRETGTILGKNSDELEGYDWPLDNLYYGPESTPRVDSQVFTELHFDPTRSEPSTDGDGLNIMG
ncbi:4Fe-4S dicluster domain-containing protein [Streptomyces sp. NPDC002952]|uniref:4Fe-4S dicluster domain-containing protein n=1 Tax=Streptomyces sp. NPDC002952 TaxID=3364673 RepID=UPI0036A578CB